jgi:hypothetical protein
MVSISDLISPAGDPGPWRSAADAWRAVATSLESVAPDLDKSVGTLHGRAWSGGARDRFTSYWGDKLGPEFHDEQVQRYRGVADKLDDTANQIEAYNQLAHALELAVGVGIAISIFSAGLGTAFGAGEAAAAAVETGIAYSALEVFLNLLAQALIRYVTYWAATFAFGIGANIVATEATNLIKGKHDDPLAILSSPQGLAEAANAATAVGSLGSLGVIGPVADFSAAHPLGWNFATGAFAGGGPAVYNLLALEHAKLYGDPRGASYDAWWKIALFAGVSGTFNAGVGKVFGPKAAMPDVPVNAGDQWLPKNWILLDSGLVIPKPTGWFGKQPALIQSAELGFGPSTLLRGVVPFPTAAAAAADHGPPAVANALAPPAAVVAPPTIGGGNYTVRPGDSMWTIAGNKFGDPSLWTKIAAANPHISNPGVIHPGQVIHIPTLLAPAGSR